LGYSCTWQGKMEDLLAPARVTRRSTEQHVIQVIHDMTAHNSSVTVQDIWSGLEGVYKKGLARSIGVSSFNVEQIERILKTATVPIYSSQPQHVLHNICKKNNIPLTSYGTLESPGRMNFSLPINWFLRFLQQKAYTPNPLKHPHVSELSAKYKKTPAQILLLYALYRNIAIKPKSVTPVRIVENFQLFDFSLSSDEIHLLESTPHRQRLFMQKFLKGHPEDPFAAERQH
uniref:Aldo_ket_red domain-containing protein n=1 Tax=Angiostrongylus cantonensis TaxID=6313 RepID=A0A0K0D6R1_ANGCA